jgi:hypothetical protein
MGTPWLRPHDTSQFLFVIQVEIFGHGCRKSGSMQRRKNERQDDPETVEIRCNPARVPPPESWGAGSRRTSKSAYRPVIGTLHRREYFVR